MGSLAEILPKLLDSKKPDEKIAGLTLAVKHRSSMDQAMLGMLWSHTDLSFLFLLVSSGEQDNMAIALRFLVQMSSEAPFHPFEMVTRSPDKAQLHQYSRTFLSIFAGPRFVTS